MKNRVQTTTEKDSVILFVNLTSEKGLRHLYLTDETIASKVKMLEVLQHHCSAKLLTKAEADYLQEAYLRLIDPDKSG